MRNTFAILLLVFSASFLCKSCMSISGTTKSGKSYFNTFYLGKEGTQYFIKPLSLKNNQTNEELNADITFRYLHKIKDSATLNFSIQSPEILKSIDSLVISNTKITVKSNEFEKLYNAKKNEEYVSRFSTKIKLDNVKELFDDNQWNFIIYNQDQVARYTLKRKFEKIIESLRDHIFTVVTAD